MSLRDYLVERDHFQPDQSGNFGFPCCACVHRNIDTTNEPCIRCEHNVNAISDEAADSRRIRLAQKPVTVAEARAQFRRVQEGSK